MDDHHTSQRQAEADAADIERQIAKAVAAERERCAKLCEDWGTVSADDDVFVVEPPEGAIACARRIRAAT